MNTFVVFDAKTKKYFYILFHAAWKHGTLWH